MSRVISIHLPEATAARLEAIAAELDRPVSELVECAAAESALDYFRSRPIDQDPGKRIEVT
jgi:predicted transcriptional regulator